MTHRVLRRLIYEIYLLILGDFPPKKGTKAINVDDAAKIHCCIVYCDLAPANTIRKLSFKYAWKN